jgi:CRISPR-associated protein Csm5
MTEHVVSFPVQVTVVSPLHIGSGEKVDSRWFMWDGQQVTLLDAEALLAQVVQRQQVIQFEQFCLDARASARDFLVAARIPVTDVAAYTLICPERPTEILSFIKTTGQPYLPGSSLKGAIRSGLLRAYFLGSKAEAKTTAAQQLQRAVDRRDKHPGLEMERFLFTRDLPTDQQGREILSLGSNYDLLRTLGLSDSPRLQTRALQVLPVQVLSAQTNHTLRPENFTLFPELLAPGVRFTMGMQLNLSFLLAEFGEDRLGLQKRRKWVLNFARYCRRAAANILAQDRKFYEDYGRPRLAEWCEQQRQSLKDFGDGECLLPVGWGTGYDAKTVTDLFEGDLFGEVLETYRNTRRLGRPRGRDEWLGPDLSPKTRRVTTWNDEEVPLGWIRLST